MDSPVTILIVTFILGQVGIVLDSQRRSRKMHHQIEELDTVTREGANNSELAAKRTEGTGNGFARAVLDSLNRISLTTQDTNTELAKLRLEFDHHIAAMGERHE